MQLLDFIFSFRELLTALCSALCAYFMAIQVKKAQDINNGKILKKHSEYIENVKADLQSKNAHKLEEFKLDLQSTNAHSLEEFKSALQSKNAHELEEFKSAVIPTVEGFKFLSSTAIEMQKACASKRVESLNELWLLHIKSKKSTHQPFFQHLAALTVDDFKNKAIFEKYIIQGVTFKSLSEMQALYSSEVFGPVEALLPFSGTKAVGLYQACHLVRLKIISEVISKNNEIHWSEDAAIRSVIDSEFGRDILSKIDNMPNMKSAYLFNMMDYEIAKHIEDSLLGKHVGESSRKNMVQIMNKLLSPDDFNPT